MPALSLNNSHLVLKRGGRIKKRETRLWEQQFIGYLLPYQNEITEFLKGFDQKAMGVYVDYKFYFPIESFFKKKGGLNQKKVPDLDNLLKIPTDIIFNFLFNDSFIIELSASKLPVRGDPSIKIRIETVPLPEV